MVMVFWVAVLGVLALLIAVGVLLDRRWGSPNIGKRDDLPRGRMQKYETEGRGGFHGSDLGGGL